MNGFGRDILKLRQPAADKLAVGVKSLSLRGRIEDPKIGSRIRSGGGRPLPAAVIRRQIAIDQLRDKITLSGSPVDKQILHRGSWR